MLHFEADVCIVDKHPGYHVTDTGKNYAAVNAIPVVEVQHHFAHFTAVLAENNLLETEEPVLGVVWDGTGYGNDGNIWGGEFFIYNNRQIERYTHLHYFPVLIGDKMAREPRLSALSLCCNQKDAQTLLQEKFTAVEWRHYNNQLQQNQTALLTSSMGRLLDAVACLLNIANNTSYEGEAAMKLEALALKCKLPVTDYYNLIIY
jgi:hydrogenase maturation protein HypF